MTEVLMERRLELIRGEERKQVVLRIGVPVQDVETAGGRDWRCPVLFTGLGKRPFPAVGVDALQAVTHALFAARVEAEAVERETGGHFAWLDHEGHGLPRIELNIRP